MVFEASKQTWTPVEIKGVKGYFVNCRIDLALLVLEYENFHMYELAKHPDGDIYKYCVSRPGIDEDFYGTFITAEELPAENIYEYGGCIESSDEYIFSDRSLSWEEVLRESGITKIKNDCPNFNLSDMLGETRKTDSKQLMWSPMELKGVNGYFACGRINNDSIPDNFNCYELADNAEGVFCRYRSIGTGILVNFAGTFITTEELPVEDDDMNGYIESEDDYNFLDGRFSFDDILKTETK